MAAAHYLGIELEEVEMEPHSGACRSAEFRAKNPNGLLPTLEDGDYVLWESNAILFYLAQKSAPNAFLPQDPRDQVEMWRWMSWGMCHWAPALRPFLYENMVQPLIHKQPSNPSVLHKAEETFRPLARLLDEHLSRHPYMLGSTLTWVDFSLGAYLVYAELAKIPLAEWPSIQAWYGRLAALPAWQRALPTMEPPV
jgi:glutathione S-transferase